MKITDEFLSWVGYLEKKSNKDLLGFTANAGDKNYTIFAKWYKEDYGKNFQGQPWCAMFVTECVKRAVGIEIQETIMPHFAYCPDGVSFFKKAGKWIEKNPKEGDIIFFKDASGVSCHVGYVYGADGENVYTVEGNTSSKSGVIPNGGAVAMKSYDKNYSRILGYGRLDLKEIEEMESIKELDKRLKALEKEHEKYNYVPEMPAWARGDILKLYNMGALRGDGEKLDLTKSAVRILCVLARALGKK